MKPFFFILVFLASASHALAALTIPFTINLSEAVVVTGMPRLVLDVGGVTRYAVYSAGSGSAALTFVYSVQSGDVDMDGIAISSPIDLNGGTLKDLAGNPAALSFTPPNTSGVKINAAVPSGYSVAFNNLTVTNANKTSMSFQLTGGKVGKTYHYTITSSGGGTPLTGSGTVTADPQTISGLNVTSLSDGKLTLSVTLSDSLGGVGVAATSVASMAVLDASLVGHWTFDVADISGTTAYDRSGNSNNATLYNGPTQVTGQVGGALNYDGVNDYAAAPNAASLNLPNTLTISAWMKPLASYVGYASHPISKYTSTTDANYVLYYFGTTSGADRKAYYWANRGGVWGTISASSFTAPLSVWKHIVLTFDSSVGGILYVDGSALGAPVGPGVLMTNTARLMIGESGFQGQLDDIRIYNRVLSPAEVSAIYNAEH